MTTTPYLEARRSWDERYGIHLSGTRNWRRAFVACALALLVSLVGNVIQIARQKFTVWVVATDNVGRIVASGPGEHKPAIDDRMKRAALNSWIIALRGVTSDEVVARRNVLEVFQMVAAGSPAAAVLAGYYDPKKGGTTPFERAKEQTIDVQVDSIVSASDRTYEMRWTEVVRDLGGEVRGSAHWVAAVTVEQNPPKDEAQARVNPLGLYVTRISWSQVRS
jgi:type IV secretory pathway TrbF-like protein